MATVNGKSVPNSAVGCRRTQPVVNHLYQGMTMRAVRGMKNKKQVAVAKNSGGAY